MSTDLARTPRSLTADAEKMGVPRLALSVEQACQALGVSWQTWRQHIEPGVKVVRVGRCKRVAVSELQAWLDANGEKVGA